MLRAGRRNFLAAKPGLEAGACALEVKSQTARSFARFFLVVATLYILEWGPDDGSVRVGREQRKLYEETE